MIQQCNLCEVVRGHSAEPHDTILFEQDQFAVVPSLGSLVPGWILIVPKRHLLSLAQANDDELSALEDIRAKARHLLSDTYRTSLVEFEHGPSAAASQVGCGVDHAHLHMVPTDIDLIDLARNMYSSLDWMPVADWDEVRLNAQSADYLLYRDQAGHSFLAMGNNLPSQLFRRVLAAAIGRPTEWDWRCNPASQVVAATIHSIRGQFEAAEETLVSAQ